MGNYGIFFFKVDFLKTVEAKVIIVTRYVYPNGTMAINKSQRSGLTFHHSLEVTHIGFPSIYQNTVFSNQTQISSEDSF